MGYCVRTSDCLQLDIFFVAASVWPKIAKPLKVVQTKYNKLSNRSVKFNSLYTLYAFTLANKSMTLLYQCCQIFCYVWPMLNKYLINVWSAVLRHDNISTIFVEIYFSLPNYLLSISFYPNFVLISRIDIECLTYEICGEYPGKML